MITITQYHIILKKHVPTRWGRLPQWPKSCGGQCPQVAPTGILLCHFLKQYKMYSKKYKFIIMAMTKVTQISACKGTKRVWWPRPAGGAYSIPPNLAGFKSGGRDKGRRKGENTIGDGQQRERDRGGREEVGGKGQERGEKGRRNHIPWLFPKVGMEMSQDICKIQN